MGPGDEEFEQLREQLYSRYDHTALDNALDLAGPQFYERLEWLEASIGQEWVAGFMKWVYGTVYDREVLDMRTRELVVIGEHVVLGNDRALGTHINSALRHGVDPREIVEVILNTAVYNGFPMAHHALAVFYKAQQAFETEAQTAAARGA